MNSRGPGEDGYILVFVMILFLIIGVACASSLNTAYLERKQSLYDLDLKQAQQAGEAGIIWALEAIYKSLIEHCLEEELPSNPLPAIGPVSIGPNEAASYCIEAPGAVLDLVEDTVCTYKFICLGKGRQSQYKTEIKCEFVIINHYKTDRFGRKVFLGRTVQDHGRVVNYQTVFY